MIYCDNSTTVRLDNYSNLVINFWFVLIFKNYAALPQDGVNDILPHKKINPSDSRPGTGMFHLGQWNKKHNIVKERLSQRIETTTQSHHVNQINQISNNFHLQQEDLKEDMTPGKQNILHVKEFVIILVLITMH